MHGAQHQNLARPTPPLHLAQPRRQGVQALRQRPRMAASSSHESVLEGGDPQQTAATDWRRLKDPAKLTGHGDASVAVQDRGGAASVPAYLRLPAEAYARLERDMIVPLSGSKFLLKLPRISMFHVWVAPEVTVTVEQLEQPPRVAFDARSCRLPGSDFFKSLEGRFAFHFRAELTWNPPAGSSTVSSSNGSANGAAGASSSATSVASAAELEAAGSHAASVAQQEQGEIQGSLTVEVYSEIARPFDLVPKAAIEATCNAVLGTVIRALLPMLMKRLGADYEKWAAEVASEGVA